jgi:hypothetical protein
MPQYTDSKEMMKDISTDVARKMVSLAGNIGAMASDEITTASKGRLEPPSVIIAGSKIQIQYVGDKAKAAMKEESMGTRPFATTMNKIKANLSGMLKKRGIKGIR